MIRNEIYNLGECIASDCYDLNTKTYIREEMGVIALTRPMTVQEWLIYGPQPLNETGALAALLVAQGILPIHDAANAVGVTPQQLINEVEGWAAAAAGGI